MDKLWRTIAALAASLHRDRVEAIAALIESMRTASEYDRRRPSLGPGLDSRLIEQFRQAWLECHFVSAGEVACAIRAAGFTSEFLNAEESVDLVWTGPNTTLIPTRKTEQVIRELVDASINSLFVVSYVFYNASSVVASLNEAADRRVSIRILLESSSEHGGALSMDGLSAMRKAVPAAELYVWDPASRGKAAGKLSAAVHAKCAVADNKLAFITSANLTSAALERNMELGVLLRGGVMPSRLQAHLNALITTNIISLWQG
jgi:cardiolipin synthase A/B